MQRWWPARCGAVLGGPGSASLYPRTQGPTKHKGCHSDREIRTRCSLCDRCLKTPMTVMERDLDALLEEDRRDRERDQALAETSSAMEAAAEEARDAE